MPQIRPISDMKEPERLSDLCHSQQEPVFLTRDGFGDLVVMSVEAYEELLEQLSLDREIAAAEAEFAVDARTYDAREVFDEIRREFFGQQLHRYAD